MSNDAALYANTLHCRRKTALKRSRLKQAIPLMRYNLEQKVMASSLQAWILYARQHKAESVAIAHRITFCLSNSWYGWKVWAARRRVFGTRLQQAWAQRTCNLAARVSIHVTW